MAHQLNLPPANTSSLVTRLRFMFSKWPRLVAEYKPAFGTVFADFLTNYTHWGYSDLDVVLGHVNRFVERSELLDHHIVTYSFGDADAVYLRGQWTVHQNTRQVNAIWKGCKHLSHGLQNELQQKVLWARRMEAMGRSSSSCKAKLPRIGGKKAAVPKATKRTRSVEEEPPQQLAPIEVDRLARIARNQAQLAALGAPCSSNCRARTA